MNRNGTISKQAGKAAATLLERIEDRRAKLLRVRETLKSRFAGLDAVVDEVMDAIAPWYTLPEVQKRPRVIGLWGMTGTGKSALVSACLEELELVPRSCWLDAGQRKDGGWMSRPLEVVGERYDGQPMVMVIDEFQHARTVINGNVQDEASSSRELWEMLDTGQFRSWPHVFRASDVMDFRDVLTKAIRAGVKVRDGKVVRGAQVYTRYLKEMSRYDDGVRTGSPFIPDRYIDMIRDLIGGKERSRDEVRQLFHGLDAPGTVRKLDQLIADAYRMQVFDGSKALIFILGNLDELYVAGKEILPELDASVLRHRHGRLQASQVQEALTKLFRIEQVGRLGFSHILFPPMDRASGIRSVQLHAGRIAEDIKRNMGVDITFSEQLCAGIYERFAIPVLGARPLVTAVQKIIPDIAGEAISSMAGTGCLGLPVVVSMQGGKVVLQGPEGPVALNSSHLDGPVQGPVDERVAVHEAGHVVVGHFAAGWRPLQACVRHGRDQGGFVIWDDAGSTTLLRSQVVGRLAMALGGIIAERWHYGEDGLSAGNSDDLQKATRLALTLIDEEGFGNRNCFHVARTTDPTDGIRGLRPEVEDEVLRWLEDAGMMAREILEREKTLFNRIVKELIANRALNAEELNELIQGSGSVRPQRLSRGPLQNVPLD